MSDDRVSVTGRIICGTIGVVSSAPLLLVIANWSEAVDRLINHFGAGAVRGLLFGVPIFIAFPLIFIYVAVFGRFPTYRLVTRRRTSEAKSRGDPSGA
jgi:uncharacterized membrane protein